MRCHENGRSRGARRGEYWTYSQEAQRGERPFSWQPQIENPFQGNARNRPYSGVARRLFGSAKRRSLLLALRAISGA
ncbi:hypothetical protein, partial [Burkholderia ubonensis]|uniref:hypothetical protein n=1 Tax=Burkholderia ubonensis TaxID=101571 RepID=UPI001E41868F